ncbi:hypothetical protein [Geodermatophilus sp. SYSU D00696]
MPLRRRLAVVLVSATGAVGLAAGLADATVVAPRGDAVSAVSAGTTSATGDPTSAANSKGTTFALAG